MDYQITPVSIIATIYPPDDGSVGDPPSGKVGDDIVTFTYASYVCEKGTGSVEIKYINKNYLSSYLTISSKNIGGLSKIFTNKEGSVTFNINWSATITFIYDIKDNITNNTLVHKEFVVAPKYYCMSKSKNIVISSISCEKIETRNINE